MIELMIGLVIVGILLGIGAPALSVWIKNGQISATADAIQNGLQLARSEAVHRNGMVRFQLTTTVNNACALSTTNSNWVVSQNDPTGACGTPPSDTVAPFIVQVRPSSEGSGSATDSAGQSLVCFNGLGRQSSDPTCPAPTSVTFSITNPAGGTCRSAGGVMNCLNVVVSSAGQIRMCDPSLSHATNPKGC